MADAAAPSVASVPREAAVEGTVLGIEGPDVIIDLASKEGVSVGDVVELWRPLRLVHPVTRRVIVDRYRTGSIRLTQVQTSIALGRVEGPLLRDPATSDVVVFRRVGRTPAPVELPVTLANGPAQPAPPVPTSAAVPPVAPGAVPADPEARVVIRLFESLRGADPSVRILAYDRYAARFPQGRYTQTLAEEALALRELVAARGSAPSDLPATLSFAAPSQSMDGTALSFAIELSGSPFGAVLETRNAGEVAYRPLPMTGAGPGYFTATVPSDRVVPARLEYFVEAVRASGESSPVEGSPDMPLWVVVYPIPHATPVLRHETSIKVITDYASYNQLKGNDRAWQTEGTFELRFGDVGVRALRSGFGVYRGKGGSVHDLDVLGLAPREVGLTYGYIEGEFGVRLFTVLARAVLGLEDKGISGGGGLGFRLGNDRKTNLSVGGELLGGIGLRGFIDFEIEPRGRVPMVVRSEVTNQPAGTTGSSIAPSIAVHTSTERGDVGVRGIFQVGYRFIQPLVVSARVSYEGRTISHAGPGLGGAVEYRW
jgi:hypothetical protein